jgi:Amt family ammonium transporter
MGKPSVLGIAAGVAGYFAATSLTRPLGYDDSLDAFSVYGIGGIIGALLTGAFASKAISGSDGSVFVQLWGAGTTRAWTSPNTGNVSSNHRPQMTQGWIRFPAAALIKA